VPITSDEDALISAIEAAPDDDAPRLVYADWLQERGGEAKADYLRAVVTLLRAADDPLALARCLARAPEIDPAWRQRVGGQFEVVLEGSGPLLLLAHVFRAIVNHAQDEPSGIWQAGRPVPVQRHLTREDAEQLMRSFGIELPGRDQADEPALKVTVRPMFGESSGDGA
jgi:uncharacterized protein (TIGR02996 family)